MAKQLDTNSLEFEIGIAQIDIEMGLDTPVKIGARLCELILKYEKSDRKEPDNQAIRKATTTYVRKYGVDAWNDYVKRNYNAYKEGRL